MAAQNDKAIRRLREIRLPHVHYRLTDDFGLEITTGEDGSTIFAVNHLFSIHGVGSFVTDAITDALTEFDILWTEIACEDDDALYTDAKALKADLLSLVTVRGLYRIDRLSLEP